MMKKKRVIISSGDPAGCGPIISLMAIKKLNFKDTEIILIGDKKLYQRFSLFSSLEKRIRFVDVKTKNIERIPLGKISSLGGRAALNYLRCALEIAEKEKINGLVTAPLSKEAVQLIEPKFCGHTEFLAQHFKVKNFVMMMVSSKLKVALLTRHISLRRVTSLLKKRPLLKDNLLLIYNFLKEKFKIKSPALVFCSINPHAGVNTFFQEEEEIIYQVIKESKLNIQGPFPADTLFIPENLKKYDCFLCGYHDQAMIPFKLLSLKRGVNLTLGLPLIRTSPAHGVAYEVLREKREPFFSSMGEAIKLALRLTD